jgi:S1-C subfamily serine protease
MPKWSAPTFERFGGNIMNKILIACLLATSAAAYAQSPPPTIIRSERVVQSDDAKRTANDAKQDAEDAKTRARLDEARARLDKAAKEVAELSMQLGEQSRRDMFFVTTDHPPHGKLGMQIDSVKEGARVLRLSPGGPAEVAGLRAFDVITSLDGKSVVNAENPGLAVNEQMRNVKPDQKVKVRVIRAGKNQDFVVVARPVMFPDTREFNVEMPEMANGMGGMMRGPLPTVETFRFFTEDVGGMELAKLTPKLGAYFGTTDGVLVVKAPENAAFKLEEGDVIQAIDGRKPDDGAHALRILRSYKTGEKLNLTVLRQRKPITLAITMPDRPEFGEHMRGMMPPMPPEPPLPGVAGPGTQE